LCKQTLSKAAILRFQTGVVGENVHINCAAVSIPETEEVHWKYHGEVIDDGMKESNTAFFQLTISIEICVW